MKNIIINLYLLLFAGPANLELSPIEYTILFLLSILVGKFLGTKRYIGFFWSSLFFFLMPILGGLGIIFSLTIILLSPKLTSKPPKGTSAKLFWATGLILFSIIGILGTISSEKYPVAPENYLNNGTILFGIELVLLSLYLIWVYIKYPVKSISN